MKNHEFNVFTTLATLPEKVQCSTKETDSIGYSVEFKKSAKELGKLINDNSNKKLNSLIDDLRDLQSSLDSMLMYCGLKNIDSAVYLNEAIDSIIARALTNEGEKNG